MGRKSATAFETKLLAIEAYERGEGSIKTISERFKNTRGRFYCVLNFPYNRKTYPCQTANLSNRHSLQLQFF